MQVSFANLCFIINICIIPYMHFQHYSLRNKISVKISFQCSLKLFGQKVPWNFLHSSMELFEQHLNNICGSMEFHGIPWNFVQIQSSMEFHGTFSTLPSSMEFHGTFNFPPKSSMEFHRIPWNFFWSSMEFHGIPWNLINFIFKKIIFLNIIFGIWLMIKCYLAKISQKRYKLHWFQYRNSYFEHPSVSENGTRSAKMACCSLDTDVWYLRFEDFVDRSLTHWPSIYRIIHILQKTKHNGYSHVSNWRLNTVNSDTQIRPKAIIENTNDPFKGRWRNFSNIFSMHIYYGREIEDLGSRLFCIFKNESWIIFV